MSYDSELERLHARDAAPCDLDFVVGRDGARCRCGRTYNHGPLVTREVSCRQVTVTVATDGTTTIDSPKKFDEGKARMDLIPPCVARLLGEVLEFGARKYSANNWAKGEGLAWSRLYAALQRHLTTWWEGREMVDPETGKSHLAHALCQLAFLVAGEEYGLGTDDRFDWFARLSGSLPPPATPPRTP